MIEKIVNHFDWLLSLISSKDNEYTDSISKATVEEITALTYCVQICSKSDLVSKNKVFKKVLLTTNTLEKKRRIYADNESVVKHVLICVLKRMVSETVEYVCSC